jgi:hypothetical protein
VFIVVGVYFVIVSVRKLLDTASYMWPSIARITTSRKLRQAEHTVRMAEAKEHKTSWKQSPWKTEKELRDNISIVLKRGML